MNNGQRRRLSATASELSDRIVLARLSLDGLSIGDALGNMLMLYPHLVPIRQLPTPSWYFTDDTVMAISVTRHLEQFSQIDQDRLAARFAEEYALDPHRGYGAGAHEILTRIHRKAPWREVSSSVFRGTGSMGNGAAMRVGPLGGFFYDDPVRASVEAARSAEVTHWHPEGKAGAMAVAVAAAFAARWNADDTAQKNSPTLIQHVLPYVPESLTRQMIQMAAELPASESTQKAARQLGCGEQVLSQDTVPFCLWIAQRYFTDFPTAIWETASAGGDVDTTCAIVGSIVSLASGRNCIPDDWRMSREALNG